MPVQPTTYTITLTLDLAEALQNALDYSQDAVDANVEYLAEQLKTTLPGLAPARKDWAGQLAAYQRQQQALAELRLAIGKHI